MQVKKFIFCMLALSSMYSVAIAQQKTPSPKTPSPFYVKVYAGYGFLTPGSFKLNSFSGNSPNTSFTVGSTGLGAGLHYGGGIGYIINDFINLGIDADYLSGQELKTNSSFTGSYTYFSNSTISYSVFSIIPNITFKAISKPNYYIYTRIGIILAAGTNSKNVTYDTISQNPTYTAYDITETYKYGLNVGVQPTIGIQFVISGNIRGFAEIFGYYLPISPTSSNTTQITRNYTGTNTPPTSTTTTSNDYTYSKSGVLSTTSNQRPTMTFNTNALGINIGIAYRF